MEIEEIFLEEAGRSITVNDGSERVSMSTTRAVSRSIAMNAASGKYRQQRLFSELAAKFATARENRWKQQFEVFAEYKAGWENVLERRKRLGVTGIEPVPFEKGDVTIYGPITRQEKAEIEAEVAKDLRFLQEGGVERIAELQAELDLAVDERSRQTILGQIEERKRLMDRFEFLARQRLKFLLTGDRPPEWDNE